MRVTVERSGGFAGLKRSAQVDETTLEAEAARQLRSLIDESGVVGKTSRARPRSGSPDRFTYRIDVESDGTHHVVEVPEQQASAPLRALVDFVFQTAGGGQSGGRR